MAVPELRDLIESLLHSQTERMRIVIGLYLTFEQLQVIERDLEPDDPPVGAVGRYEGVPVFLTDALTRPLGLMEHSRFDSYDGLPFAYVQMDIVN